MSFVGDLETIRENEFRSQDCEEKEGDDKDVIQRNVKEQVVNCGICGKSMRLKDEDVEDGTVLY